MKPEYIKYTHPKACRRSKKERNQTRKNGKWETDLQMVAPVSEVRPGASAGGANPKAPPEQMQAREDGSHSRA